MDKFIMILKLYVMGTVLLPQIVSSKYDLNSEAKRLYGADLATVLQNFRRTPEYILLLEEKYVNLELHLVDIIRNAKQFIIDTRLRERLKVFCGLQNQGETSPSARNFKNFYNRANDEETFFIKDNFTLSPIALLDLYAPFRSSLTIQEKNRIREIAFETAGETIHMIIRGMGPLDDRSTRQPIGEEDRSTRLTTERDHRHIIFSSLPNEINIDTTTIPYDGPLDEAFRAKPV